MLAASVAAALTELFVLAHCDTYYLVAFDSPPFFNVLTVVSRISRFALPLLSYKVVVVGTEGGGDGGTGTRVFNKGRGFEFPISPDFASGAVDSERRRLLRANSHLAPLSSWGQVDDDAGAAAVTNHASEAAVAVSPHRSQLGAARPPQMLPNETELQHRRRLVAEAQQRAARARALAKSARKEIECVRACAHVCVCMCCRASVCRRLWASSSSSSCRRRFVNHHTFAFTPCVEIDANNAAYMHTRARAHTRTGMPKTPTFALQTTTPRSSSSGRQAHPRPPAPHHHPLR